MIGYRLDGSVLRAREKSLDRGRNQWLERCKKERRLNDNNKNNDFVYQGIKSAYSHAAKRLPDGSRPVDDEEAKELARQASTEARFVLRAFDLKKEPEYLESGRRLADLEEELITRK